MKIRNIAMICRYTAATKRTGVSHGIRSAGLNAHFSGSFLRFGSLVILLALVAGAFSLFPSVSPLAKALRNRASRTISLPLTKAAVDKRGSITKTQPALSATAVAATALSPRLAVQAAPESVATYASDCLTPKTDFNVGEIVCAKTTGAIGRRLNWADPSGVARQTVNITSDPQTDSFTIPSATELDRGTWRVTNLDADAALHASASFTAHDPTQATADLITYKSVSAASSSFTAGGTLTTKLWLTNLGPDTAQSVTVTDTVPTNATFVSLTQDTGPTFSCATPSAGSTGTSTCTIASLAKDAKATFTVIYQITSVTSDITDTASITSTTNERDTTDNTSSGTVLSPGGGGGGGGGGSCTLTCPASITQNNDPNQNGAVVNYTTPTGSGCGTVTCDPPSGSFFSMGTTQVTCSGTDDTCSFLVTINDANGITITLNAPPGTCTDINGVPGPCPASPLLAECHTSFTDPGATAKNGAGQTISYTTQIFCEDETTGNLVLCSFDINRPGSYIYVYTATVGTPPNTVSESVTRTVFVVDTTPPVIVNGASTLTVECHTTFNDPVAATDSCAGSVPVITTGSVDVNTPGTYTLIYNASDSAGNDAVPVTRTVNVVDTTPPALTCPANVSVYLPLNSTDTSMVVNYPAATATEACSTATITYSKASGTVFNVGPTTVTVTATDAAGNTSTCSFTVTVLYNFTGFFSPIGNPPTLNKANAGQAIPVKFSLSGNKGLNIFAPNSPTSVPINCDGSAPETEAPTVTAGSSSLSYDAASDQYIYVWKTDAAWAGTCRQLIITLNDGTIHVANFKFR